MNFINVGANLGAYSLFVASFGRQILAIECFQFNIIRIRNAVMKIGIQSSEVFLCETGQETFDYLNLPVILIEWDIGTRYDDRLHKVLKFFRERGYVSTSNMCEVLK
ncbi:hypothetical protein I4U23_020034 [Adineta vaga]|nr:hypothetical protein I4U23_020034 [Adineta vaga]